MSLSNISPEEIFSTTLSSSSSSFSSSTISSSLSSRKRPLETEYYEYAIAITDLGFTHLLKLTSDNKHIILSFLNTFVPEFVNNHVTDVNEESVAVPSLPNTKIPSIRKKNIHLWIYKLP